MAAKSGQSNTNAAAEVLHEPFLTRLLGVRDKTADDIVLRGLRRYLLQVHFWQQIMYYCNITILKVCTLDKDCPDCWITI